MIIRRSFTIEKGLWSEAIQRAGPRQLSLIISRLLEMWLAGEVRITIEPREKDVEKAQWRIGALKRGAVLTMPKKEVENDRSN